MKMTSWRYALLLLTSFAINSTAIAEDTEDRTAPIDQGPAACLDRDVNSATASCILRGNGGKSDRPPQPLSDLPGYNDDSRKSESSATIPTEGTSAIKTDR